MTQLWFETALLPGGWHDHVRVTLADAHIAALDIGVASGAAERFGAALPGLCNLHSHAFQRAMAGLGEVRAANTNSFWTWREIMYRFAQAITPEALEAIAAMAFVEMLESGFVRVGEFHYLHHQADGTPFADLAEMGGRLAAAAAATGIALTLLPVLYQDGGFGGVSAGNDQRRFLNSIDRYAAVLEASRSALAELDGGIVAVAPHSLRAVGPAALAEAVALAGRGPIHVHIAEQQREVAECLAWSGARPVEWLLDHAPVDHRWCLVHATHMSAAEIRRVAARKAVAGLCPITEASLGDGIFAGRAFVAHHGRYGVGSDSNVLIDAASELAMLEYSQRLAEQQRNVMARGPSPTGRSMFDAARVGGAQALGVAPATIEVGAPGDLVALDCRHPSCAGRKRDDLLDAWLFAGHRNLVADVWRLGRHVVRASRHIARDRVVNRYHAVVTALLDG